jgi:hypothetical protein
MKPASEHRFVDFLERAVLFLLVLFFGLHTLPHAWGKLNTDFPNYYMSARLVHEGFDTTRINEWAWLQREKDHRAVDVATIGILPITPFSTLVMWPLAGLAPLTAKHVWIVFNLALLIPLFWMLRNLTGLSWQRVGLVFALSFPLHRNFLFGQFYLLLLVLIVAAVWAYVRGWHGLAGGLIAVAAACKIFPILLFVFFVQRRAWRALIAGAATLLAAGGVSVAVFGWGVHWTYVRGILPWAVRGEGLSPYAPSSASVSSLLHYLFLYELQWNPHPWHSSVLMYAVLKPVLQMLVLAPAILLIRREDRRPGRILLEWSTLLAAALGVSTMPASYHFTLMALPVCVLAARLLERRQYGWLAWVLILYLGIGFPVSSPAGMVGPAILIRIPRFGLMLLFLAGCYWMLWRDGRSAESPSSQARDWTRYAWAAAMAIAVVLNVRSTFAVESAMRGEYAYRLPLDAATFLAGEPKLSGGNLAYAAFTSTGFHLSEDRPSADRGAPWVDSAPADDLSFTSAAGRVFVERGLSPRSEIVELSAEPGNAAHVVVEDAREPMLSANGQKLGFVRDDHGRGRLMMRGLGEDGKESSLTPSGLNVYEASFLSEHEYAFSAVENGRAPEIYLTDVGLTNAPLGLGESRYPALSPDGRWMAYSRFERGVWNLWLRDQKTGVTRRIGDVPCNQIESAWREDSRTLLYGTDCGRSLWLTAVAERRVIP